MKLLLIEDDDQLASGLKQNLLQQGYSVDHFDTIANALDACSQATYDLIIFRLRLARWRWPNIPPKIQEKQ